MHTNSETDERIYSHLTGSLTLSDIDEFIKGSQLMDKPYARIIEQPAPASFRFRYEKEYEERCGNIGSIIGVNSTYEKRTFPTIQVMNYQGSYAVVVSCVTKDGPPYRPHPHYVVRNLKKDEYTNTKDTIKRGIYAKIVKSSNMICSFSKLGILSVKIQDIRKSLELRKVGQVDPFGTGFDNIKGIDLTVVRLCFQVFLKNSKNIYSIPIPSIVSEPIYDKKTIPELTIMKFSHYSAPATGGTEVILLCDRVPKESIEIWFYEKKDSSIVWESPAEFYPSDVHKQVAISFRTPRYHNENLQQPVPVYVELRNENKKGKPRQFQILPMERDPDGIARKRQKVKERIDLERLFQGNILRGGPVPPEREVPIGIPRISRQTTGQRVKAKTSSANVASCSTSAFSRTPMLFATNNSTASIFPSASVGVSTSLYPEHPPYTTISASDHSYSLAAPSSESMIQPTMHQMIPTSPALHQMMPTSASPVLHQMMPNSASPVLPQMMPTLESLNVLHEMMSTTESPILYQRMDISESIPSPAMSQTRSDSESSNQEITLTTIDDGEITEKLDSLGLNNTNIDESLDLTQDFFASLFDDDVTFPEQTFQD